MRRCGRLAALVGVFAALAAAAPVTAGAQTTEATAPLMPKADILVDAATGRILAGDNIHEAMHPASTAKIVTALTAIERLAPGTIVPAAPNTAAIPANKMYFPQDAKWPLDQMLASLMMVSANDAAYALATKASGSLDAFSADADALGKRLGMRESTFNDPSGLDDETSFKGGPFMSAYDLAIATRNALTVPAIAKWASTREYSFTDPAGVTHYLTNHNKMLPGGPYAYDGDTGFKTGFTSRADHTLVETATRNGRTLIAVILGSPDSGYTRAATLLDAGFAMPANARGIGESLPKVAVSPYASRAADKAAFARLGATAATDGNDTTGAVAAPSTIVPESVPVLDSPPLVAAAPVATTTTAASGSGHGFFQLKYFFALVVVLLGTTVFLRRRAVKRRRSRRIADRRRRAAAMRSGGLPVVDGRYRPGMRVGPPVESHVRVRPVREMPPEPHRERERNLG